LGNVCWEGYGHVKTFRKWRRNSTHLTKTGQGGKVMQAVLTSVIRR